MGLSLTHQSFVTNDKLEFAYVYYKTRRKAALENKVMNDFPTLI
jgi:hypothetical protein